MTAIILGAYSVLASTLGQRVLRRASWPHRSPTVGILTWQSLTGSVVLAVILFGAVLALPAIPFTTDLADLLHACAVALKAHYATPGGVAVAAVGAALVAAVVVRISYVMLRAWASARRRRAAQRRHLAMLAQRHSSGALIVRHRMPAVYCVPGRQCAVVMTTAALETLDEPELAAALAHERAHLRSRHDLLIFAASALSSAFPFVGLFSVASEEVAALVEMHADDAALKVSERRVLATALVNLAGSAHPAHTLAAGSTAAVERVQRLSRPLRPLGPARAALILIVAITMMLVPIVVATTPGLTAVFLEYCPVAHLS